MSEEFTQSSVSPQKSLPLSSYALLVVAALLVLVVSACRTSRGGFEPLGETTAEGGVEAALTERLATFRGFDSFARIRVSAANGRTQRFDARISSDSSERLLLEALSPIGTTLFSLLAADDRVVFLNHQEQTAWEGDLVLLLPIFGLSADTQLRSQHLIRILAGLPLSNRAGVTHRFGATGLAETHIGLGDSELRAVYEPPSFPPDRVVITQKLSASARESRIAIEHLEMNPAGGAVPPLGIPPGYRCCVLPEAESR